MSERQQATGNAPRMPRRAPVDAALFVLLLPRHFGADSGLRDVRELSVIELSVLVLVVGGEFRILRERGTNGLLLGVLEHAVAVLVILLHDRILLGLGGGFR